MVGFRGVGTRRNAMRFPVLAVSLGSWIRQRWGLSAVVAPGACVVVQEGCLLCSLMSPGVGADLRARSSGAHLCVRLHLVAAVTLLLPEGVVHPQGILEEIVLCLAGSWCRLVPPHVAAGLVRSVCACAHCVVCAPPYSVHGISGCACCGLGPRRTPRRI